MFIVPEDFTVRNCTALRERELGQIHYIYIDEVKAHPDNPRMHPKKQIRQIARSIEAFGFRVPVLIDEQSRLICGHGRVAACRELGIERIPALRVTDLSEAQVRALMIADNRLSETSHWDDRVLGENLKIFSDLDLDFDLECIGFDYGDIEQRIIGLEGDDGCEDEADDVPDLDQVPAVSQEGDLWVLGDHRLLCADCTKTGSYEQLMGGQKAAMVFSDPPYNLSARQIGQVCSAEHGDFAMAAGEMTPEAFTGFLGSVMGQLCRVSASGSIHYLFMDWRHAREILDAGSKHYTDLKNLCVWVKDRPGMGSFYRSQHELIFVFKSGDSSHQNNFELGQHGRTRSNVWCYPSARSMTSDGGDPDRDEVLNLHPTIKPVKLIEEAILDCSRRGQIVLDPFMGSGSTLIACEKTQRVCFGMELSPRYVDVAVRRWQAWTGRDAIHQITGQTYARVAEQRS